jgi:DNA repair protein RadA/Sms
MKYICSNCESEFLRWEGKCSSCNEWGSLVEHHDENEKTVKGGKVSASKFVKAKDLKAIKGSSNRLATGLGELDRVVGGGLVGGSVTLLAGEPGVGKSTLLLQVAIEIAKKDKVLYVSCEESASQLNARLKRLYKGSNKGVLENLLVVEDTNVDKVAQLVRDEKPSLFIVDSIQAVASEQSRSIAGSIGQVRVSGSILTRVAKDVGVPLVLVGQITKQGSIAGPKVLEHLVDTVLYFEGGQNNPYRVIRSVKNRFGSTNEIGVFEMRSDGLIVVENPH